MATITPTVTVLDPQENAVLVTWAAMANGDVGAVVELLKYPIRSVQISGTFGTGGSVTLQGSNNSSTYIALTDPQGNAVTKTAAGLEQVQEVTRQVRPEVTAGDGTTALTVAMLFSRVAR